MNINLIKFLGIEIEIPEEISNDINLRHHLALIEYAELTGSDGLWFYERLKNNYKIRINDTDFDNKIETIIKNNKIKGINNG